MFKIFKALNQAKIRYLVAGGVAINLHGIERATADLDLIIHLEVPNVLKFAKLMTRLGYQPKVPVKAEDLADPEKRKSWIDEKNMIVFSFINPKEPQELIDIFVQHPLPFEGMYKRKAGKKALGTVIPVLSIDDLIVLKKRAGRPKDIFDLGYLMPLAKRNKND
ncbi:MAG: nucleotidyl transferase AbiEii/AbiGii toxin family protein [Deltaproteobacteria bacterium]|nr:nucleotidyl transferase AbiEii/AbiGii toxin family protein [Deltaproteobacteria bacterium]